MIDEHGEGLYPDLRERYGIDLGAVALGQGPAPSLVLLCVRGLRDDSLTVALANGGSEYIGWGMDRHLLAGIYDAINQNTRATGNWQKKPPVIPQWPRPQAKADKPAEKKPVSVRALYGAMQKKR